jgi:hypothetical protein
MADLSQDDQTIAAAVQWLVKGDAGQRVLMAWAFGWEPAQKIAGRDWLYPYLIYTLNDPYAAVRFDAWKSLQTLPGFANFSFEYTAAEGLLKEAAAYAYERWLRDVRSSRASYRPETLLDSDGRLQKDIFQRLQITRDDKRIILSE